MFASEAFLWNAGSFLATTTTLIEAFEQHAPKMLARVREAVEHSEKDLSFTRLAPAPWKALDNVSFDYAIMEKVQNLS